MCDCSLLKPYASFVSHYSNARANDVWCRWQQTWPYTSHMCLVWHLRAMAKKMIYTWHQLLFQCVFFFVLYGAIMLSSTFVELKEQLGHFVKHLLCVIWLGMTWWEKNDRCGRFIFWSELFLLSHFFQAVSINPLPTLLKRIFVVVVVVKHYLPKWIFNLVFDPWSSCVNFSIWLRMCINHKTDCTLFPIPNKGTSFHRRVLLRFLTSKVLWKTAQNKLTWILTVNDVPYSQFPLPWHLPFSYLVIINHNDCSTSWSIAWICRSGNKIKFWK